MSPDIQAMMRKAGLDSEKNIEEKSTLVEIMEAEGLGLEAVVGNLASLANNSANEALRMKANETALRMHGALKETAAAGSSGPSFTLNIINGEPAKSSAIPEGVNPIFLPRQLLTKLTEEKTTN